MGVNVLEGQMLGNFHLWLRRRKRAWLEVRAGVLPCALPCGCMREKKKIFNFFSENTMCPCTCACVRAHACVDVRVRVCVLVGEHVRGRKVTGNQIDNSSI